MTYVGIHGLVPGQEVRVFAGSGDPVQQDDHVSIVVEVSGGSALLADGTRLAEYMSDGFGIELTGNVFDLADVQISPEAQEFLTHAENGG